MKNKENIIKIVVAILFVSGLSFYAGTKYPSGQNGAGVQTRSGQFNAGGAGNRAQRADTGFIGGEVISKDAQSITVKLREGGSNIVFLNASTTIIKSSSGAMSDVDIGTQVMVTGGKNPDGSVSAQSIQIRPENFGR